MDAILLAMSLRRIGGRLLLLIASAACRLALPFLSRIFVFCWLLTLDVISGAYFCLFHPILVVFALFYVADSNAEI